MAVGFIAATIPAKVLRVSDTNLFQIAMSQTGDPLQWVAIAELNGIVDPWIVGPEKILIPPLLPSGTQTGILVSVRSDALSTADVALVNPPNSPAPNLPGLAPSLDFSKPADSQYLPLV